MVKYSTPGAVVYKLSFGQCGRIDLCTTPLGATRSDGQHEVVPPHCAKHYTSLGKQIRLWQVWCSTQIDPLKLCYSKSDDQHGVALIQFILSRLGANKSDSGKHDVAHKLILPHSNSIFKIHCNVNTFH